MSDITLILNNSDPTKPFLDWAFGNGDLVTGDDLQTMVLLCLFTDRRAPPDYVPRGNSQDLRGCWVDTYEGFLCGSRFWTLYNGKKTNAKLVLNQARDYAQEALKPLIDGGIASKVVVTTQWNTPTDLGVTVNVFQPNQVNAQVFNFSNAWQSV